MDPVVILIIVISLVGKRRLGHDYPSGCKNYQLLQQLHAAPPPVLDLGVSSIAGGPGIWHSDPAQCEGDLDDTGTAGTLH
jgi:hypothetical protein